MEPIAFPIDALDREIHVWIFQLDARHRKRTILGLLSPAERDRMQTFAHQRLAMRFALCRAAVRTVLGAYLDCGPSRVRFESGDAGKLQLCAPGWTNLRFNVTHSGRLAMLAIASGHDVGIDLERVRPLDALDALVARVCSAVERIECEHGPLRRRTRAFFRCWTRKEAYLKALGCGLIEDLQQISVHGSAVEDGRIEHRGGRWIVCDLPASSGYVAAMATERPQFRIRCSRPLAVSELIGASDDD